MDLAQILAELGEKLAALLASEKQKSFDEGVASAGSNPDVKFTQADLDAAVQSAVSPLNEQIAALQVQVDGIPQLVAAAIADLKAQLKAKYDEQQVVESQSETGFGDLLK